MCQDSMPLSSPLMHRRKGGWGPIIDAVSGVLQVFFDIEIDGKAVGAQPYTPPL